MAAPSSAGRAADSDPGEDAAVLARLPAFFGATALEVSAAGAAGVAAVFLRAGLSAEAFFAARFRGVAFDGAVFDAAVFGCARRAGALAAVRLARVALRAPPFAAVLAADFRGAVRDEDFLVAFFAAVFVVVFAAVFGARAFPAVLFIARFAVFFAAVRAEVFRVDFFAAVFPAAAFFADAFFVEVFFTADFFADFFTADFFVADFVVAFFRLAAVLVVAFVAPLFRGAAFFVDLAAREPPDFVAALRPAVLRAFFAPEAVDDFADVREALATERVLFRACAFPLFLLLAFFAFGLAFPAMVTSWASTEARDR